ncbi:MAG: c-type cytochrome [Flavihumibacter sp.]|nr:c-type cytochrome [Flavihumibacter sp.]
MKSWFVLMLAMIAAFVVAAGCGGSEPKTAAAATEPAAPATNSSSSDKGIGKFTNVAIAPALDNAMAESGLKIYDLKCSACHKLTDEKLVGPGWKEVTKRRTPEWIMNFVTNVDEMLNKDAAAQAQLEICMVRMPNQNLSDDDARHVYEFMRKNDGVK